MNDMVTSVEVCDLDSEIRAEKRPVLLAWVHWGFGYKDQIDALEDLSKKYSEVLKVCLLDEGFIEVNKALEIKGSPTFSVFHEGKEKGRMLGKADIDALSSFVLRTLPNFQDDNGAKS